MKNTLLAITVALSITACNNNPKTTTSITPDTTGNYQRYLADTARAVALEPLNDTLVTNSGETFVKVDPNAPTKAAVRATPAPRRTARTTRSTRSTRNSGSTASTGGSGSSTSTGSGTTETEPVVAKKKGWSNAAKGTAIGAGTGAVAGAIISKKKGKGAIIGGVVGAAGGYILGRKKDKNEGRVQ